MKKNKKVNTVISGIKAANKIPRKKRVRV